MMGQINLLDRDMEFSQAELFGPGIPMATNKNVNNYYVKPENNDQKVISTMLIESVKKTIR